MAPLRAGEVVEIRTPAEILATLDEQGMLGALPFMPEMIPLCGRRFTVHQRAEKLCDTIHYTGSRRLPDTVLLEDLRCDGSAHEGCQAECRFFWKEAWLRRTGEEAPRASAGDEAAAAELVRRSTAVTRAPTAVDGKQVVRFRCQATQLHVATEPLSVWDPRPYLRELTTGNVPLGRFVQVATRAAVQEPMRKLGLIDEIHLRGTRTQPQVDAPLHLQPGDWVQVKSQDEIRETLDPKGRNRGLWFDREMMAHCGGVHQVRRRVTRFIDDHDGKMIELKSDCVTLEGVVCSGDLSLRRWFCPRAIYPYWREAWLRRVPPPQPPATR